MTLAALFPLLLALLPFFVAGWLACVLLTFDRYQREEAAYQRAMALLAEPVAVGSPVSEALALAEEEAERERLRVLSEAERVARLALAAGMVH